MKFDPTPWLKEQIIRIYTDIDKNDSIEIIVKKEVKLVLRDIDCNRLDKELRELNKKLSKIYPDV